MDTGLSRKIQRKKVHQAGKNGEPLCERDCEELEVIEKNRNGRDEDHTGDWETEQPPYAHRDIF